MNPAEQIILSNLELTRVFFALALLLVSAHIFGYFFQHFKIPRVIGEIFGGFILGPSMLGFAFPQAYNWLFDAFAMEGKLLSLIYWIGLALLMFISGFEIQKSISKDDKKIIVAVLLGSTLIPFVAGWLAPFLYDFTPYVGHAGNLTALTIVIAVAVAVTSIPVISKIFIDLGIVNTRFSKIVLATATIHDVILWVALALATELASGNIISKTSILMNVLITVSFFAVALLVMPRLMRFINGLRSNLLVKSSVSGYILFICLLFAGIASVLNVNVVFGALLAGIVVGMMTGDKFTAARMQIREMGMGFFIPIYFAIVGLKLDLIRHFDWKFFVGFLIFATFFQMAGTILATRLIKLDWLSSFNFGMAMNARGGPGIVLATVAYDLGIINEPFFVALVLIAITTSLGAGVWFRVALDKGYPLIKE